MAASVLFLLLSQILLLLEQWIVLPLLGRLFRRMLRLPPGRIDSSREGVRRRRRHLSISLEPSGAGLTIPCSLMDSEEGGVGDVTVRVHAPLQFIWRMLRHDGSMGLAEGYMAGEWDAHPSSVKHLLLLLIDQRRTSRRGQYAGKGSRPQRCQVEQIRQPGGPSSCLVQSKRNVQAHYDLGNSMFRLFLDRSMTYSCALFAELPHRELNRADMELLTSAQANKNERIVELLALQEHYTHRVLEIGCGWGALGGLIRRRFPAAEWTGLTLSEEQHAWSEKAMQGVGRAEVKLVDYRQESGWHLYDRIVAVEMIEAVGHGGLPTFFRHLNRLLRAGGRLVLQAITCPNEESYAHYCRRGTDFIRKHIFPGGHLPSLGAIERSLADGMHITRVEHIGRHYEPTLDVWCSAWRHNRERVLRELGRTEEFFRAWDYYFSLCSALFARGNIDVVQLVIEKA